MLTHLAPNTRQPRRRWLALPAALLLSLGSLAAQAQVAPTPAPAQKPLPTDVEYYLDGRKTTQAELASIQPSDISYMQMLKGSQQQQIFGTSTAGGVAVVTTKANANSPAVLALNKRISAVAPMTPATPEQTAAMTAAKAYITQNYPSAELQMVGPAKDQAGRYQAIFKEKGQRLQLFFDGQGHPVKE